MTRKTIVSLFALLLLSIADRGLFAPVRSQEEQKKLVPHFIFCCGLNTVQIGMTEDVRGLGSVPDRSITCKEYMEDHPKETKKVCDQLRFRFGKSGICEEIAPFCEPQCRVEIKCDCNGDGQDETSKTFDQCDKEDRPTKLRSTRCEDWAFGQPDGFDVLLGRQVRSWLETRCPADDCHKKYQSCEGQANMEYEKCNTGRRLTGIPERCVRNLNYDVSKCKQERDRCLNKIRKFGPAPKPAPLPTPTPPATGSTPSIFSHVSDD